MAVFRELRAEDRLPSHLWNPAGMEGPTPSAAIYPGKTGQGGSMKRLREIREKYRNGISREDVARAADRFLDDERDRRRLRGGLCILEDGRLRLESKGAFLFIATKFHEPFTFRQMMRRFTNRAFTMRRVLNRLCATGYVTRVGSGKFLVPEQYQVN